MKSIFAAVLLASLLPLAAGARECNKERANLCQDGFQWDAAAQACVEIVTG